MGYAAFKLAEPTPFTGQKLPIKALPPAGGFVTLETAVDRFVLFPTS